MFETVDIFIVAATAIVIFFCKRNWDLKARNACVTGLSARQLRRYHRLNARDAWEVTAEAYGFASAFFIVSIFNAATNLSHYDFFPRFLATVAAFLALTFVLQTFFVLAFRYIRNNWQTEKE